VQELELELLVLSELELLEVLWLVQELELELLVLSELELLEVLWLLEERYHVFQDVFVLVQDLLRI